MAPAPFEEDWYAGVSDPIESLKAISMAFNDAGLSESLELVRYGLYRHPDFCREITDI